MQWNMGILKDRSDCRRELPAALRALQHRPLGGPDLEAVDLGGLATRADNAVRPSEVNKEVLCGLFVLKMLLIE